LWLTVNPRAHKCNVRIEFEDNYIAEVWRGFITVDSGACGSSFLLCLLAHSRACAVKAKRSLKAAPYTVTDIRVHFCALRTSTFSNRGPKTRARKSPRSHHKFSIQRNIIISLCLIFRRSSFSSLIFKNIQPFIQEKT
jgi:hypothetical protein